QYPSSITIAIVVHLHKNLRSRPDCIDK
ncbi:unnamed protein product, partial [Rotaria magnacalcarata]